MQGVQAAVKAGSASKVASAVAKLPPGDQELLQQLLQSLFHAVGPAPTEGEHWQQAALAYLSRCTQAQLVDWRWRGSNFGGTDSELLELNPFILHESRAVLRKISMERLERLEAEYDLEFQDDPELPDEAYMEGVSELSLQALWRFQDEMARRDQLLRPLLRGAVRAGAACLPLAVARSLDEERNGKWGGAGAWWDDEWEPSRHARFHPRFRAAVRTLLLVSHRGLPAGNTPDGDVIHLPPELLHRIVRCMAGPGSEAAWVPLVGELPRWVDLNSNH